MTILFICGFSVLLILALAICLKPQDNNSRGHMIDAGWMDSSEKFKLISRWGAQY